MSRTFYVDSRLGSDSNDGSAAAPWASLDRVNDASLEAGDTILLARDATFNGTLSLDASGVAGAPITIGAYGSGADPVLTGGANGVAGNGQDHIVVRDIHISGVSGAGIQSWNSDDWVIDNVSVDHAGGAHKPGNNEFSAFQFRHSSNLTIANSDYHDVKGDGVFLWDVAGVKILNNNFEVPQGQSADNIHTYLMRDYEIRGNVLSFEGATDSGKGIMVVQESVDGVIAENTFDLAGNAHYAIGGTIENGVIEKNHFIGRAEGTWSAALNITETLGEPSSVSNMAVRDNFFDGSGIGIYTWDGNGAGAAHRDGFEVTGNIFKDLRDPAMVSEAPVQLNGTFADNTFVNTAAPDIGGTAKAWSMPNNVHAEKAPAWNGAAVAANDVFAAPAPAAATPAPEPITPVTDPLADIVQQMAAAANLQAA
jgi:polysaccharidase protein